MLNRLHKLNKGSNSHHKNTFPSQGLLLSYFGFFRGVTPYILQCNTPLAMKHIFCWLSDTTDTYIRSRFGSPYGRTECRNHQFYQF